MVHDRRGSDGRFVHRRGFLWLCAFGTLVTACPARAGETIEDAKGSFVLKLPDGFSKREIPRGLMQPLVDLAQRKNAQQDKLEFLYAFAYRHHKGDPNPTHLLIYRLATTIRPYFNSNENNPAGL